MAMRLLAVGLAAVAGWLLFQGPVIRTPRLKGAFEPRTALRSLLFGLLAGVVAAGLTGIPEVSISIALLGGASPILTSRLARLRGRQADRDRWPDFLAALQGALAGGASMPEAFTSAAVGLGGGYARMGQAVSEQMVRGTGFPAVLDAMRHRLSDPFADRVLMALALAHRTGGPRVGEMLAGLAASIADELRLRKAHEAALTQQRLTALVALIAPWALLLVTIPTNPTAGLAYRGEGGLVVLASGAAATLVGYLLTLRTARLSEPPRLFR